MTLIAKYAITVAERLAKQDTVQMIVHQLVGYNGAQCAS
jgi:hypothetical protein